MGWDPMYLNALPGCLCLLKLFLNAGNEWKSFSKAFDDDIAVVTLKESENIVKVQPCLTLIRMRDSVMAMASKVNLKAICDVL
jgi:hypothetical protein